MLLNQEKVMRLLKKYSINFPKTIIVEDKRDIRGIKKFPVVLKVDSPFVIHKSDLGLVFTELNNLNEIQKKIKVAEKILKENKIKEYTFIIQEKIIGQETIIGMKYDSVFGPVILFGLGGVFVEILRDISMRIAPLTRKDCVDMISEIKGKKLLEGFRNFRKVNKEKIIELLLKTSRLVMNEKDIMEIDFNPVMIDDKKAIIVDARIIKKDV
jgi:acetyl-CoA synthetase (ADP-forming)